MNDYEIHQDQPQGWWFCRGIVALYTCRPRKLNGEECMLLGKIWAMYQVKKGGCTASNRWLSEWWDKDLTHTSKTISKFVKMGIVGMVVKQRNRRTMWTAFNPEAAWRFQSKGGIVKNHKGDSEKSQGGIVKNHNIVSTRRESKPSNFIARNKSARGNLGVFKNGNHLPNDEYTKLCQRFDEFTFIKMKWRDEAWAKPSLGRWRDRLKKLVDKDLNGDFERAKQTIEWYMENPRNKYVKRYVALTKLIEDFDNVEKKRCIAEKVEVPGSHSDTADYKHVQFRSKVVERKVIDSDYEPSDEDLGFV